MNPRKEFIRINASIVITFLFWIELFMVELINKLSGMKCSASEFYMGTVSPQEIYVFYPPDEFDTDYLTNYDVVLPDGTIKDLKQAFKDHDVIVNNYNTSFFFPRNEEDKIRGFTL